MMPSIVRNAVLIDYEWADLLDCESTSINASASSRSILYVKCDDLKCADIASTDRS
jgi:hypothetical protein